MARSTRPSPHMLRPALVYVTLLSAIVVSPGFLASHTSAQQPQAFSPAPLTTERYGIRWADEATHVQYVYVEGEDGNVFAEVALPIDDEGMVPQPIPTILMMTAYANFPVDNTRLTDTISYFVPLGYAVAIGHAPGTGRSAGCWDMNSPAEVEATVRLIEFFGDPSLAWWSNGNVGMYGLSYDAITQIAVASRAAPDRIQPLKAIVPVSGLAGEYDAVARDGVSAAPLIATYVELLYDGFYASFQPRNPLFHAEDSLARDQECRGESIEGRLHTDLTGEYSAFWETREARQGADQVHAAVLLAHGLNDLLVPPVGIVGWFDRLPAETPHKAVITQMGHGFPDHPDDGVRSDWTRMVHAWFDQHLLGLATGTDDWPSVQLQDTTGRWRVVPSWPDTGGPAGALALAPPPPGADIGVLGASHPSGTSTFISPSHDGFGGRLFRSDPLPGPLHLTGMPVLDVWVTTTDPDLAIAAVLRAYDAQGELLSHGLIHGARAVKYAAPLRDNYFHPEAPDPVPLGPTRLAIRLTPVDLVVPADGYLELTIAGSVPELTVPSATPSTVVVHHDCATPSFLRFELPAKHPKVVLVQRMDGSTSAPSPPGSMDGAGLAVQSVCGSRPLPPLDVVAGGQRGNR